MRWSFSIPEISREAVCASSSIPGILPARHLDGRRLVDGAVVEPVPVTAASAMAAGSVLAVNVVRPPSRQEQRRGHHDHDADPGRVARRPFVGSRVGFDVSAPSEVEGEISARVSRWESVFRSFHIMQHRLATCSRIDVPMIEPQGRPLRVVRFPPRRRDHRRRIRRLSRVGGRERIINSQFLILNSAIDIAPSQQHESPSIVRRQFKIKN